ncbi:super-infection exclusion protein B [Wenyingzhuangia sp. IMCC45467]
MNFSFSDLIDFSKIPIKIFILFAIVSGILLFGSDDFLTQLKLVEFEKDYGKFFGITFIVCISFIALSIIYYFIRKINSFIGFRFGLKPCNFIAAL